MSVVVLGTSPALPVRGRALVAVAPEAALGVFAVPVTIPRATPLLRAPTFAQASLPPLAGSISAHVKHYDADLGFAFCIQHLF